MHCRITVALLPCVSVSGPFRSAIWFFFVLNRMASFWKFMYLRWVTYNFVTIGPLILQDRQSMKTKNCCRRRRIQFSSNWGARKARRRCRIKQVWTVDSNNSVDRMKKWRRNGTFVSALWVRMPILSTTLSRIQWRTIGSQTRILLPERNGKLWLSRPDTLRRSARAPPFVSPQELADLKLPAAVGSKIGDLINPYGHRIGPEFGYMRLMFRTRPFNVNLVWAEGLKLPTEIGLWYFSFRADVYSNGRACPNGLPIMNLCHMEWIYESKRSATAYGNRFINE